MCQGDAEGKQGFRLRGGGGKGRGEPWAPGVEHWGRERGSLCLRLGSPQLCLMWETGRGAGGGGRHWEPEPTGAFSLYLHILSMAARLCPVSGIGLVQEFLASPSLVAALW